MTGAEVLRGSVELALWGMAGVLATTAALVGVAALLRRVFPPRT